MRAIYVNEQEIDKASWPIVEIKGKQYHHLCRVSRVKKNEKILFLLGGGRSSIAEVVDINKSKIIFQLDEVQIKKDNRFINVVLGIPKKDAFESTVKICVECGVKKLIAFRSHFAQSHKSKIERINSLIESSMIQSNNPYELEFEYLESQKDLEDFLQTPKSLFVLSPISRDEQKKDFSKVFSSIDDHQSEVFLFIGPEGGWSKMEESLFYSRGAHSLTLSPFIMRTPTAVASAIGALHAAKKVVIDAL